MTMLVQAQVLCGDAETATRVMESFTRQAVGLALDGIPVQMTTIPNVDDEPTDDGA